jgi:predicted nucleic acid-binding protein
MSATRYLVDTNILVRFLSGDPPGQAAAARKLFARAAAGEITLDVSPMIVAKTYYTLHSFYGVERPVASAKLSLLLQQHGIRLREASQVLAALQRLQEAKIGFADAYLAAGATEENLPVASFDRDFDKLGVTRHEPTP